MRLKSLSDWCALLDVLKERGATQVKITAAAEVFPDDDPRYGTRTGASLLTGLEFTIRPTPPAPAAPQRRTSEDTDEKIPTKPLPAGMGYK